MALCVCDSCAWVWLRYCSATMAPVLVLTLSILASVVTSVLLLERFAPCPTLGNARAARVLPIANSRFSERAENSHWPIFPRGQKRRQNLPKRRQNLPRDRQDLPR